MPKTSKTMGPSAAHVWAVTRISLGFIFLWAFLDKLWGLGLATCRDANTGVVTQMCDRAWLSGGSPTSGFLQNATKGPFESFYQSLAGNGFIDVLFMLGLLLIGVALIAGIGMRLATIGGVLLMLMMWSAALWPTNNPFLDEHIIYALVLVGLLKVNDHQKWGLRKVWLKQPIVQRFPILQ